MKKFLLLPALFLMTVSSCSQANTSDGSSNQKKSDSTQMADSEITAKVKASIMVSGNSLSARARVVSVNTSGGVVTLTGTVDSNDEMRTLEKIAKSISGVKRVDNQLTLTD